MIDATEYWEQVVEDYIECACDEYNLSEKDKRLMALKLLDDYEMWDFIYSKIYEELQHYQLDIEEL